MKYLKMLGLAAIAAMGLMAFLGASSASATVLCKTTVENCPAAWDWPVGTPVHANLVKGSTAILESGTTPLATCTESTLFGETTNTGSETETVDGEVKKENLTWGGCNTKVATVSGGLIEIHYGEKGDGVVTAVGFQVTVELFGVSCTYTASKLGTLTEPASNTSDTVLDINAEPEKSAGGFLCPSKAKWTAEYTVTEPVPLYVSTGLA